MDVEGLRNFLPQTNGNGNNNAINTLIKTSKTLHFIKEKEKNKRRNFCCESIECDVGPRKSTYAMYNKSLIHACFVRGAKMMQYERLKIHANTQLHFIPKKINFDPL